jgi:twitching motility two-component system response regulator PilH
VIMAKVVIIDDSKAAIDMLAAILTGGHHSVASFTSSVGVEEKVAAHKPDIILLDIVMPERNGYEVLRGLKRDSILRDIPVILVSSKSEDTDIRWGKRQGAHDYIVKPFTADTVLSTIQSHL